MRFENTSCVILENSPKKARALVTRDDVVSQRLKFGGAFLWFSWESKIVLFF